MPQSGSIPCGPLVPSQRWCSVNEYRDGNVCAMSRRPPAERTRRGLNLPGRGLRVVLEQQALHFAAYFLLLALNLVERSCRAGLDANQVSNKANSSAADVRVLVSTIRSCLAGEQGRGATVAVDICSRYYYR